MRFPTLAVALLASAAPAYAQRVHDAPPRPLLQATADTNSAGAYFRHGLLTIQEKPREAAAAFYWASRLNPGWADPLYGRRIALLLSDRTRLVAYLEAGRRRRSAEIQALDSLQLRALRLDPLLHQQMDRALLTAYFIEEFGRWQTAATGSRNQAAAAFEVENLINDPRLDPYLRAWFAFSDSRLPAALQEYERALERPRAVKSRIYTDMARIRFLAGDYSRALDDLLSAIDERRQDDARDLVYLYESKGVLEHSMGLIHERSGNVAAAREAYGRALSEDISYFPAHARLGALALAAGDTAAALAEYAVAVEVAPQEPDLRYQYALVLMTAGLLPQAERELALTVEMEPHFAAPHLVRAAIALQQGQNAAAGHHLSGFLARAARDDPQRPAAERALASIQP